MTCLLDCCVSMKKKSKRAMTEQYKKEIIGLYGKNVFDQMLRIEILQKKMSLLRNDIKAVAEELNQLETELHKIKVISFAGL